MFIKTEKPALPSVFYEDKLPRLTGLTRSYEDPHWFSNTHVHYHETELLFMAKGKATVMINQQQFAVEKGDVIVVESGYIHSVTADPEDPSDLYGCTITDYGFLHRKHGSFLRQPELVPVIHAGEKEAFLAACWKELFSYQGREDQISISVCNLIAATLASVYDSLFQDQKETYPLPEPHFTYDILVFIYGHYAENITLERLANEFHMSAGHISHEFSKAFGISPINYAIDLRIEQAKWLLAQTDLSVKETAEKVGYRNLQHFSKIFQKRTGYLPQEYKILFS